MKKLLFIIILILSFLIPSFAQEMAVPVEVQYNLFSKIITFDRNLKQRVGNEIIIGVVYQGRFRKSLNVRNEFIRAINESEVKKINDIPVRYIIIDLEETDLLSSISKNNINMLYITPLRAVNINNISEISRKSHILTLTGVPEYCELGISVGIGQEGEKPSIIINLSSAKDENVDFSSQLLKLAKVINKNY